MEKNILLGLLTKTLNKSEQEVTDLLYQKGENDELILKEGVLDVVLELDSVRVDSIKKNAPVPKDRLDNEYKRGQKESMEAVEKALKDKYSLESEKKGIDLIDEVLSKQTKASKMSDDEVKKHPLYLKLESDRIDKETHEKVISEFSEYKKGIEMKEKFSNVKTKAAALLDSMKPIVSENPTVAQTRKSDFLAKFEQYDYQQDGDNIIILKADGSRLEDGHGNPLPFNEHVKNIALINYDFPAQQNKGNSGTDGEKIKSFNIKSAGSPEEYVAMMRGAKSFEEKSAIQAANPEFSKV